jgi:hypothetical protein
MKGSLTCACQSDICSTRASLWPHKNHRRLLEAMARVAERDLHRAKLEDSSIGSTA